VSHLAFISPKKVDVVETIQTKRIGSPLFGIIRASEFALSIALTILLTIVLVWAAAALTQSPLDDQHAKRISPSGPALKASGVSTSQTEAKIGVSGGPKVERPI
jgi:hypothetical protein